MAKILLILALIIGIGAGVGAGMMLKPAPVEVVEGLDCGPETNAGHDASLPKTGEHNSDAAPEYVKMNNQFVIPVVKDGKMAALVVLSISIEVTPGGKEVAFQREPKLRDEFNQVLFDHANAGGFDGVFTDSSKMVVLRDSLYEVAKKVAGTVVRDILIAEIVRQDV